MCSTLAKPKKINEVKCNNKIDVENAVTGSCSINIKNRRPQSRQRTALPSIFLALGMYRFSAPAPVHRQTG
jgi:hypothetical protein